jgi:hypothetical protein
MRPGPPGAYGTIADRLYQSQMAHGGGPVPANCDPARARRQGLENCADIAIITVRLSAAI